MSLDELVDELTVAAVNYYASATISHGKTHEEAMHDIVHTILTEYAARMAS